jgi:hypothetical protein
MEQCIPALGHPLWYFWTDGVAGLASRNRPVPQPNVAFICDVGIRQTICRIVERIFQGNEAIPTPTDLLQDLIVID